MNNFSALCLEVRKKRLFETLAPSRIDFFLVSVPYHLYYLAGINTIEGWLFATKHLLYVLTDPRYTQIAGDTITQPGVKIVDVTRQKGFCEAVAALCKKHRCRRMGFEAKDLSYHAYSRLRRALGKNTRMVPTHGVLEHVRRVKDPREMAYIRKAVRIACEALHGFKLALRRGVTEKEAADTLAALVRRRGAEETSFAPIVAYGKNSVYPHAVSTEKPLGNDDFVLVDFGARYRGYNSDLTRIIFSDKIPRRLKKAYSILKKAQHAAFDFIRPGVKTHQIDNVVRSFLKKEGLEKYFVHATGHGIGLEVHEMPSVSSKDLSVIEKDMVFTIEPGIYIPGAGGLRVEDMVRVTHNGIEVLSNDIDKSI
jgi:Xaa-Pro aminopeptidase